MPKAVDHDSRRRKIADAVCRLADKRGFEGVSLRDVAAEADVSMGAVQRCFHTKEDMLRFALQEVGRRALSRARGAEPQVGAPLPQVTGEGVLSHRSEAKVWLAFAAQAAVSPPLAEVLRANYAELHGIFTRLLADRPDPEHAATTLLALADGLTTHVVVGHLSHDQARAVLEAHLAE
ncbi:MULTISPECIES: TetR/AcrR family transcriptional regulator [Actinosynnema]|uniref:TetR/AcrR family transcriptional regulator n=1 Tax=Actinosynnema TaxID=40566 RepID=UPI0020A324DB|nr:TetR family transcriptional regulator C-terminal domain-containing protein [Actinosynnema pretiosum]MCP2093836.1 transcriptional regulator, TetR family [Actinosynnema pretiosum]